MMMVCAVDCPLRAAVISSAGNGCRVEVNLIVVLSVRELWLFPVLVLIHRDACGVPYSLETNVKAQTLVIFADR